MDDQPVYLELAERLLPNSKPRNQRKLARRLAKGLGLRPRPPRRAQGDPWAGLPDGTRYWWRV